MTSGNLKYGRFVIAAAVISSIFVLVEFSTENRTEARIESSRFTPEKVAVERSRKDTKTSSIDGALPISRHIAHRKHQDQSAANIERPRGSDFKPDFIEEDGTHVFVLAPSALNSVKWREAFGSFSWEAVPSEDGGLSGIEIKALPHDSVFWSLGLKEGDRVKGINGYPIANLAHLPGIISTLRLQKGFVLTVEREGSLVALKTIAEAATLNGQYGVPMDSPDVDSIKDNNLLVRAATDFQERIQGLDDTHPNSVQSLLSEFTSGENLPSGE